jgi:hypothetical protein
MVKRALIAAGTVLLVAASLWYVTAPPRDASGYGDRAVLTLEALHSQVQAARLWAGTVEHKRTFATSATVGLRELDADANDSADRFASYEPPSGTEPLRDEVTNLADRVVAELDSLRVEAEAGDWDAVVRRARSLEPLADELQRTAEQVA